MHFCQDELMAIVAAVPFLPWAIAKVRACFCKPAEGHRTSDCKKR